MNQQSMQQEWERQAEADRLERDAAAPGDDPAVSRYRLVQRAVRSAAMPQLPADFAAQVARALRDFEEQSGVEQWLLRGAIALGVVGVCAFAPSVLAPLAGAFGAHAAGLPWRLMLAAGLGVLGASLADVAMTHRR